jgi:hypothetical protein
VAAAVMGGVGQVVVIGVATSPVKELTETSEVTVGTKRHEHAELTALTLLAQFSR